MLRQLKLCLVIMCVCLSICTLTVHAGEYEIPVKATKERTYTIEVNIVKDSDLSGITVEDQEETVNENIEKKLVVIPDSTEEVRYEVFLEIVDLTESDRVTIRKAIANKASNILVEFDAKIYYINSSGEKVYIENLIYPVKFNITEYCKGMNIDDIEIYTIHNGDLYQLNIYAENNNYYFDCDMFSLFAISGNTDKEDSSDESSTQSSGTSSSDSGSTGSTSGTGKSNSDSSNESSEAEQEVVNSTGNVKPLYYPEESNEVGTTNNVVKVTGNSKVDEVLNTVSTYITGDNRYAVFVLLVSIIIILIAAIGILKYTQKIKY